MIHELISGEAMNRLLRNTLIQRYTPSLYYFISSLGADEIKNAQPTKASLRGVRLISQESLLLAFITQRMRALNVQVEHS